MNRLRLLLITLLISSLSFGQIIKIQAGVSASSLDWQTGSALWKHDTEKLIGYPFFVGLDYFDKKFFNLSSNIGLLRKGGKVTIKVTDDSGFHLYDQELKAQLDYLSLNTTFDVKYQFANKITPFIGVGPRIDLLLSDYSVYNQYSYGLLLGGGLKYDINKIQIGLRVDYFLNFNDINKTAQYGIVRDKTFTTNIIVGYRLK